MLDNLMNARRAKILAVLVVCMTACLMFFGLFISSLEHQLDTKAAQLDKVLQRAEWSESALSGNNAITTSCQIDLDKCYDSIVLCGGYITYLQEFIKQSCTTPLPKPIPTPEESY